MMRLLAVVVVALALPASALAWGGSYPTGDSFGTYVQIQVSDAYPVDQALPQDWATYLGTLVHGPELARLTLDLIPLSSVQSVCGAQALACYDAQRQEIFASPEDQLDAPPAKEIVTHEYGHHLANNSNDAPWQALDYGTKRWSSYENICAKAAAGTASPGDEGSHYDQNSGEAFAESYRVLNLQKQGQTNIGWDIVNPVFFPNTTALTLLEEDIASPWAGPTVSNLHGSFGTGVVRTFKVQTQLDGSFSAHLVSPTKAKMQLALYNGSTLVQRGANIRYEICGQRTLTLKVQRLSGRGKFTVNVSKP
ncbi:MAG TPA: hypothetical protein VH210_14355 [Gaiellaceae bacterium]|nr:hypothetical protein [Gaiellaceae bacterium]